MPVQPTSGSGCTFWNLFCLLGDLFSSILSILLASLGFRMELRSKQADLSLTQLWPRIAIGASCCHCCILMMCKPIGCDEQMALTR